MLFLFPVPVWIALMALFALGVVRAVSTAPPAPKQPGLGAFSAGGVRPHRPRAARGLLVHGGLKMTRALALALALAVTGPSLAQTVTCETSGAYRHCFDYHGYLSTEEQSPGGYVHGWDSEGRRWTTWEHDGRAYTWPTR
jgi:hypothetical protein